VREPPRSPAIMPLGRHGRWLTANNLLANLSIDRVFLLIQRFLLLFGDMAPVLARHVSFLLANLMILMVQLLRLTFGDFAFFAFLVDASVLVFQAAVNLGATRMVFRPVACQRWRLPMRGLL